MTFTEAAQTEWAREMCERVPRPPREQYHQPTHLFTDLAGQILGVKGLLHWRGLSAEDAEAVLVEIRRRYPERRDESRLEWDDEAKVYRPKEQ